MIKHLVISLAILMITGGLSWASLSGQSPDSPPQGTVDASPLTLFQQHIPGIAEQYIGMPVKLGGNPRLTGTTDNSSLFYTIYAAAAQRAGLTYKAYLPMRYLLANTSRVDQKAVRNGDLIVLNNDLAALIYQVDPSGRLHFIYASEKRRQVTSFHSENLVYQAYWLEHLRGFFRLDPDMLQPSR